MSGPAEERLALRELVRPADTAVVRHLGPEEGVGPGRGPALHGPQDHHRLDAARLRRLDVLRALREADERDQILEPVLEIRGPDLELLTEERLVDARLPALRPHRLDVTVAGDSEAPELFEEARLLDTGAPGAAHACFRHRSHGSKRHAWRELGAEDGAVVVSSAGREEEGVHPAEWGLRVKGLGLPAHVRPVGLSNRMETLGEVLVLVRPAQDDHGRDLPELRRGERYVVVD